MSATSVSTGLSSTPQSDDVESARAGLRLIGRIFLENKLAGASLIVLIFIIGFSWLGPHLYHSNQVDPTLILPDGLKATNAPPGPDHPLGMDNAGYDVLGRLMLGGQNSLVVGFAAGAICTAIGVAYGAISGFFARWLDMIMMRVADVIYAFPVIFLFIFLSDVEQPSEGLLIVLLATITWVVPARLVRGETLSLRTCEYVQAVRTMGGRKSRAIWRHIVPNAAGTIVVTMTLQIADAILILSTLQYFGFGLPPTSPTWGGMLDVAVNNASAQTNGYWWEIYPAGLLIVLTVLAVNFIGDAIRDALKVRLRRG